MSGGGYGCGLHFVIRASKNGVDMYITRAQPKLIQVLFWHVLILIFIFIPVPYNNDPNTLKETISIQTFIQTIILV